MPRRATPASDARRLADELLDGLVIRGNRGGEWAVQVGGECLRCALPGRLKADEADRLGFLAVGDRVTLRRRLDEPDRGVIEAVLPRVGLVGRGRPGKPPQIIAANVDQLAVVVACLLPEPSLHTIDRYLALAAACDVPALVVLNKTDLDRGGVVTGAVRAIYDPLGVTILPVSAMRGDGIGELAARLRGRISAVIGPSGAGKSSLLNACNPGYRLRTGEVMAIGKGRHTTTETTLLPLDGGGWVADTPGIKTIALVAEQVAPGELDELFVEFEPHRDRCRFADCAHRGEPDCAVRAAAEAGEIAPSRYESYLRLHDEVEAARRPW